MTARVVQEEQAGVGARELSVVENREDNVFSWEGGEGSGGVNRI